MEITGTVADYVEQLALRLKTEINSNNSANSHGAAAADRVLSSMVIELNDGTMQSGNAFPTLEPSVMSAPPPSAGVVAETTVCRHQASRPPDKEIQATTWRDNRDAAQPLNVAEGGHRGRQHQPKSTSVGMHMDADVHPRRSTVAEDFPYDPGLLVRSTRSGSRVTSSHHIPSHHTISPYRHIISPLYTSYHLITLHLHTSPLHLYTPHHIITQQYYIRVVGIGDACS